jgi:serine/threonine protein kinase
MSATPGSPWLTTNPEALVGQVFAGRFKLLRLMGAGGMGAVFEATQTNLSRRVAVKVLNPTLARDKNHVERFRREAQAASTLHHRHIVDVIDFGEAGELVFYAMEFLEGEDLSTMLKRVSRLPWREARALILQIVRGLRAAHAKGIIHRDIKPANCFLVRDDDGQVSVKLLDFGIAKVVGGEGGATLTRSDELFGTVKYMAPEQADGRGVDARSDVYAVGVVAYRMLTGRVPFDDDNAFRVLTKHQVEPPQPLREIIDSVPVAVEEVVLRALAKAPADRWQSMGALEAALLEIDEFGDRGGAVAPAPITEPPAAGRRGTQLLSRTDARPADEATEILPPPVMRETSPRASASGDRDARTPPASDSPIEPSLVLPTPLTPTPNQPSPPAAERPAPAEIASAPEHVAARSHDGTVFQVERRTPWVMIATIAGVLAAAIAGGVVLADSLVEEPATPVVAVKSEPTPKTTKAPDDDKTPTAAGPRLAPVPAPSEPTPTPATLPPPSPPLDAVVPEPAQPPTPPTVDEKPQKPQRPQKPTKTPTNEPAQPAEPPAGPSDDAVLGGLVKLAKSKCAGFAAGEAIRVSIQTRTSGGVLVALVDAPNTHTALGKCVASVAKSGKFAGDGTNRKLPLSIKF